MIIFQSKYKNSKNRESKQEESEKQTKVIYFRSSDDENMELHTNQFLDNEEMEENAIEITDTEGIEIGEDLSERVS